MEDAAGGEAVAEGAPEAAAAATALQGLEPRLKLEEVTRGLGLLVPTLNTVGIHLEQFQRRLQELSAEVARKADREGDRGTEAVRLQLDDLKEALKEKANLAEVQQCNSNLQALQSVVQHKAEASKAQELEVQVRAVGEALALKCPAAKLEQLESKVETLSESVLRKLELGFCEEMRLELRGLKEALSLKAGVESVEQLTAQLQLLGNSLTHKADRAAVDKAHAERQSLSNALLLKVDSNDIHELKQRFQSLCDSLACKAEQADLEVVRRQLQAIGDMASPYREIQHLSTAIGERAEAAKLGHMEARLQSQGLGLGGGRVLSSEGPPSPGLSTLQSLRAQHRSSSLGGGGLNRLPQWSPNLA